MIVFGPEAQLERWEFSDVDEEKVKDIGQTYSLNHLLSRLLIIRGLANDKTRLKDFLHPPRGLITDTSQLSDPEQLQKALLRIKQALHKKEKIVIHGDPDADGITGTTILVAGLRHFQAKVSYGFPVRAVEGHGLQLRIIDEAHQNGVTLLISTDCGTKDVEAVAYAKSLGIDVIITDHHVIGSTLPDACAVVNPQLVPHDTPFKVLSGAGVSFKLIVALFSFTHHALPKALRSYLLILVAFGTLSDRMSMLVPMNRLLVQRGVEALSETNMEGLKVLKRICGHGLDSSIQAHELTRTIVPRLNAPGRIGNPKEGIADSNLVVDLLLLGIGNVNAKRANILLARFLKAIDQKSEKPGQSLEQATIVNEVNEKRKQITSQIEDEIDKLIEAQVDPKHDRIIIVQGNNWNPGVIGIDADRLKERFLRPAIIFTTYPDSDYMRGSARSIAGINIYGLIDELSTEFLKKENRDLFSLTVKTAFGERKINAFGGHSQACGFTIHKQDVKTFISGIHEKAAKLEPADFYCRYEIVDILTMDQVNLKFLSALNHMGPYGQHFDFPAFMIKSCRLSQSGKPFGNKYQRTRFPHIQFDILYEQKNRKGRMQKIKAIGFGLAEKYGTLVQKHHSKCFDIICTLELDLRKLGRKMVKTDTLRLNVKDIRLSEN